MASVVGVNHQDRVRAVLDIPLNRFLGMQLRDDDDPSAGIWFPVGTTAQNQAGVLHGGVLTTLLHTGCYLGLLPSLTEAEPAGPPPIVRVCLVPTRGPPNNRFNVPLPTFHPFRERTEGLFPPGGRANRSTR